MADTRGQIKESIELNVGRENQTLENKLCDEALKVALTVHPFDDAISQPSDFTIVENSVRVDISSISDLITIVTARIVQSDGDLNELLHLKNRTWWDREVINPEDNARGWPKYGLHFGNYIYFDRPVESNLKLRLRVATEKKFDNDSVECPIALLDKFVIVYATAKFFKQLKQFNAANEWMREAVGPYFYNNNKVGGLLLSAIEIDKANIAEEMELMKGTGKQGLPIQNNNDWHDDYGNIRAWF